MKIGIPASGKTLTDYFAPNFGRCPFFIIYNTDTKNIELAYSNEAQHAAGGAGIQASQSLIKNNVDLVIVPQVGPNAWNVLKGANIAIYSGFSGTIEENLKAFQAGELTEVTQASNSGQGRGQGRGRRL